MSIEEEFTPKILAEIFGVQPLDSKDKFNLASAKQCLSECAKQFDSTSLSHFTLPCYESCERYADTIPVRAMLDLSENVFTEIGLKAFSNFTKILKVDWTNSNLKKASLGIHKILACKHITALSYQEWLQPYATVATSIRKNIHALRNYHACDEISPFINATDEYESKLDFRLSSSLPNFVKLYAKRIEENL